MSKNLNISEEVINKFLNGKDPQEGIVAIECTYNDDEVSIIYKDKDTDTKRLKREPFYPFLWAKKSGAKRLCANKTNGHQDREKLKKLMEKEGISIKKLNIHDEKGNTSERLENGYNLLFTATKKMSYSKFIQFFKNCGVELYDDKKDFLSISPVEQFMIRTGKRFFKGYEDYDDLLRLQFDFETEGLNPMIHRITQVGLNTNKGYSKLIQTVGDTKQEKDQSELELIDSMLRIMSELKPDVITGHNSENFDWNFAFVRLEVLGTNIADVSKKYFRMPIYKSKKPTVLKLGGEMEYFYKTNIWGYSVTDSLHAVRRAQAIDSNMKKADLKYVTKYSKLNKPNRVYVPGDKIEIIYQDTTNDYAFNDKNGLWYIIDDNHPLNDGYEIVTGKYIVERYLIDDLYETDKVELRYNQPNFLLGKLLPTTFNRSCTMGTAAIWKLIMMTWSFENNLAIPNFSEPKRFTGGLSRLLKVGYVANCVKLDYNSLYPSIILTWMIEAGLDISHVMLSLLAYMLSQREKYKDLKGLAKKNANKIKELIENNEDIKNNISEHERLKAELKNYQSEENSNDKKQLPLKITSNAFFGSYGSPNLFPWGDVICAEKTTCIGRQCLRLMVKWFSDRGYVPVVGDSVTYDTPVYIKYENGDIDVKAISELFSENDAINFGNEQMRDLTTKPYTILTRNGWKNINYVYRHKSEKNIHRIETKDRMIDVTEDHSLFNDKSEEVKPKNLNRNDKIEVYDLNLNENNADMSLNKAWLIGLFIGDGSAISKERTQSYFSKKDKVIHYNKGTRRCWKISNTKLDILNKAKSILKDEYGVEANIKDHLKSSHVYNLKTENARLSEEFSKIAYTEYRFKKIPASILNSTKEIKKSFLDGFMAADGYGMDFDSSESIGQKSQITMAGLSLILKSLNFNYRVKTRKDKENFITFNLKNRYGNELNDNYSSKETNLVWKNTIITNPTEYVYDISTEDGTFVAGIGCITAHNTDGFNFAIPTYEGFENKKYIGKGLNRIVKKDKEYTGVDADVAEFNDLFMRGKMGLGLDEKIDVTVNLSRKNYLDLMEGEIKYVGNTVKSKRMPIYIEKFMENSIKLLLNNKGDEFLKYYYDYIEKIYNYQIPLKEIASKGKIKKTIDEYKSDLNVLTKAGRPKSRQVWYELCINNDVKPDIGTTVYYINIGDGKKKSSFKDVEKKTTKGKNGEPDTYEIINNCIMLDNKIVDSDEDFFCTDEMEYNAPKYIEQFNNRIKPLLVCFSPDIRSQIIINKPDNKKYFTEEQSKLTSGYPNKVEDQDTYEQLMTMEDKEIAFWLSVNEFPPFVDEIGVNWEEIVEDYNNRMEKLKDFEISQEVMKYNNIIDAMTKDEVDDFIIDAKIPKVISEFLKLDLTSMSFISKKHNIKIGTIYDIIDKEFTPKEIDEESES